MNIAYLVNQYPKVSHSFVRREVLAVENCGMKVARYSIRSCESELVDGADKLEQELTKVILGVGVQGLAWGLLRVAATRPIRFIEAVRLMFKVGWHSETGDFAASSLFSRSLHSFKLVCRIGYSTRSRSLRDKFHNSRNAVPRAWRPHLQFHRSRP